MNRLPCLLTFCVIAFGCRQEEGKMIFNGQGEIAGEVTQSTVILQSRLTESDTLIDGELPGSPGFARFEWSTDSSFLKYASSNWLIARAETDFIVKNKIDKLLPGTVYWYRLRFGLDSSNTVLGDSRHFKTLPAMESDDPIDFIVTSCFNYFRFHYGRLDEPGTGYQGADKNLGYPGLSTIRSLQPDFVVFTGDNVYYDTPQTDSMRAKSPSQLRRKWHEQLIQPRFIALFSETATYWEKDDHDHRFNDSDTISDFTLLAHLLLEDNPDSAALGQPSHRLGVDTFREQVPIVDPQDSDAVTYRTYRLNKDIQVWFTENRDYRSPNNQEDGPAKSIWGKKQRNWLKSTLLQSDASFKLLISPTPLIGPDDAYKNDNHVNSKGYRYEGQAFLSWVAENRKRLGQFFIIHGDRHWQYHSLHPLGIEEFSVGAIDDSNARKPRLPGDPKSTDPDGLIQQPYVSLEVTGGFLRVYSDVENRASLRFIFYDETGKELYSAQRSAD
ncbi:MAG: alkaline phosphatase D family protein [Cyclobacteriaceae bacterium]|nr:alkaline phosphatase D family protein [Cyclobacteriaceae bacterium HetDA_MAG_MS6]